MLKIKRNSKPAFVFSLIASIGFVASAIVVALFENVTKRQNIGTALTGKLTNLAYINFTFMVIFLLFAIAGIVFSTSAFADKSKRRFYASFVSIITTGVISISILLLVIKIASKSF